MRMRKGSWVQYKNQLGIIYDMGNGMAEVHFVDDEGDTMSSKVIELDKLARVEDFSILPEKRRPVVNADS